MGHLKLIREHLRDLDDGRCPFCSLTAVEMDHEKLAMGRQLGRFMETAGVAPGVAPAVAAVATTGGSPPSSSLTREALIQRVDDESLGGYGG
jgi:hypothetical protein